MEKTRLQTVRYGEFVWTLGDSYGDTTIIDIIETERDEFVNQYIDGRKGHFQHSISVINIIFSDESFVQVDRANTILAWKKVEDAT